jgi:hypothetical protein
MPLLTTTKPTAGDNENRSLNKVNAILKEMHFGVAPSDLAPASGDTRARSLRKINAILLLIQQASAAVGEAPVDGTLYGRQDAVWAPVQVASVWMTPGFSNGSSYPLSPVRYRLEPGNICRLRGIFAALNGDGTSMISGLPEPPVQSYLPAVGVQAGVNFQFWALQIFQGGAACFRILPDNTTGGQISLDGLTYIYA